MLTVVAGLAILLRLGSVGGRLDIEITSPRIQPVYVKSGSKLELICEGIGTSTLQWLKAPLANLKYSLIDSSNENGLYTVGYDITGKEVVSLIKDNVTQSDEGSYMCLSPSIRSAPFSVEVYIIHVEETWGLIKTLGSSRSIGCTVSMMEQVSPHMHWSRRGKALDEKSDPDKYNISINHNDNITVLTLVVKNVGENDVGIYQCNIILRNGNKYTHDVNLYAYSQVKSMGRSRNLVAGRSLELNCKAWGWPLPNVSWEYEGRPLNLSDNRVTVVNGTLKIEEVTASDRAVYVCTAWNSVNGTLHETRTSILVRVKGKLAVLWPLLGIALELSILSCIIFVYERNRSRQRAEQERKEAAEHQSNSNAQPRHQGRDNVRYRK